MRICLTILACSLLAFCACGCDLTFGPKVETRYVIVQPGLPVEILENRSLRCRAMKDEGGAAVVQDVGGWVAMPPKHWEAVKSEVERLRQSK